MQTMLDKRCRAVLARRYWEGIVVASAANFESVYARYLESGCADTQFEKALMSQDKAFFAQRLGEMLLFERLSHEQG